MTFLSRNSYRCYKGLVLNITTGSTWELTHFNIAKFHYNKLIFEVRKMLLFWSEVLCKQNSWFWLIVLTQGNKFCHFVTALQPDFESITQDCNWLRLRLFIISERRLRLPLYFVNGVMITIFYLVTITKLFDYDYNLIVLYSSNVLYSSYLHVDSVFISNALFIYLWMIFMFYNYLWMKNVITAFIVKESKAS